MQIFVSQLRQQLLLDFGHHFLAPVFTPHKEATVSTLWDQLRYGIDLKSDLLTFSFLIFRESSESCCEPT